MSAVGCFGRFTFSHLAFHIPTLAGSCLCLFCVVVCLVVLFLCFWFLFCKCLGIPNSPRSLDLDDRQGLIARSAMQQKKNAVQCLLGSLDICFIEFFWCQATKIKLATAKVWPKGGPKNGSVLRPQKWPRKNKYIISAYDSGQAHFWGHETAPKVAPLFCPQRFAERC